MEPLIMAGQQQKTDPKTYLWLVLGLIGWGVVYAVLKPLSMFLVYNLFSIPEGSHLGESLQFFLYDTPKVLLLLTLIVFLIGIVRSYFTPENTRKILAGKRESLGNVLGACLGIVTPFCSCSAVPLFMGFIQAGVPLGVTFSFLIAAPMVNEIAVVMLYGLLGWKVAVMYMATGLGIAILAGWVIGHMNQEKNIEDWVIEQRTGTPLVFARKLTWNDRINVGKTAVKEIVGKIWPYVIAGIAVGALIHGYVPENFMAKIMGRDAWWSVPAAVIVGVPMYSNAAGIIPVVDALLGKGAALGTVLAFMMSVIALSLPEMVILRKVLKPRLIALFIGVVACGILIVGYLFNYIFLVTV